MTISNSPGFHHGETVVHRSTREMGRIEGEPTRSAGEFWYRVRFVRRVERIAEDDLDPLDDADESLRDLAVHGRWGRIQALRCALAVERITHENRSTVYAFKSQRILFEPYQYKPLLKILDSADRRLLIADEVGLGKTIESGLILTELEARKPLERVLIVCPSRLRDKWREELNRKFEQEFDIFDKKSFEVYLERLQQNPRRGRMRAIISVQSLRSVELRDMLRAELGHLDLVIFDEAHHARNPGTQTSDLLRDLCEVGDCVVLLTATPIHLTSRDLFTLLQALRPVEFRDAEMFDRDLKRHSSVHEACRLIRAQRADLLPQVISLLDLVFVQGIPAGRRDPLAVQVIQDLGGSIPTNRRGWVELERRIQDLHLLSTVITRTRKRDVQENAPFREATVLRCQWTREEDDLYQRLVEGAKSHGWFAQELGFGQIQRARQAASCLPAAAESHGMAIGTTDDDVLDLCDISPGDVPVRAAFREGSRPAERLRLSGPDSKYDTFREILRQAWSLEPDAKILVFTFFVGTSKYLTQRLKQEGIGAVRIAGDVPSNPHRPDRDDRGMRMREFRDDPDIRVMVSTEVGSEGLDFQFCHHLVNYDLPWNPMVVEQRIGRIDRYGQESEKIYIHNLIVEGTVEDRILHSLFQRIGIFRESIGDLEAILGETISELQRDYISGKLTPDEAERRVEQAARAIEERRLHLETLERNAGELFGHEDYIRDEMNRVGRLGRFITEESMIAVLKGFLESHHPSVRMWNEGEGIWGLRLTEALRQQIQAVGRKSGQIWIDRSQNNQLFFTMRGDVAFHRPEVELVNVVHPLLRAGVESLHEQLEAPISRLGQTTLRLSVNDDVELGDGVVFLAVFREIVEGIRGRRLLETLAWSSDRQELLAGELGERLLYLVLEQGTEWDSVDPPPPMPDAVWERIESEMLDRSRALREQEQRENDAMYLRRQRALRAEHEHDHSVKEQRLRTAELRGHQRIVPAMRGQIQKAEAEFQSKLEELEKSKHVSVRLSSEPVALCVVNIHRES